MSRPRVYNGCGRKRGYVSESEAMAVKNPNGLRAYRCGVCSLWHHTRMSLDAYLEKAACTASVIVHNHGNVQRNSKGTPDHLGGSAVPGNG